MTRPIVISSNLIVDEIELADGRLLPPAPGGAALWAALGAATVWPAVAMFAGVGDDVNDVFGDVIAAHGFPTGGLVRRHAATIRSRLSYRSEDTRNEVPALGAEYFAGMQLTFAEVPPGLLPAAGTYVFRDLWPAFWAELDARRADLGPVLWELQGEAARAQCRDRVIDRARRVDIFSLNMAEAEALLGVSDPGAALEALMDCGVPVAALRMGADGALIGAGQRRLRVLPAAGPVRDVTGGGNAFCGGFLAGWIAGGGDVVEAARAASVAAAVSIAQVGPPAPQAPGALAHARAAVRVEEREGGRTVRVQHA